MPFRRQKANLGARDWAAVGLDFVIVLVGVLLAFQINSWNENRIERRAQSAALERLLSESEEAIHYLSRSVDRFEEGNQSRAELLTRLREDDWEGFNNDAMAFGIVTIGRAPPAAPPRSAYEEIIASGRFAGIGDAAVRDAVTEYYASVDYLNGMSEYIQRLSSLEPYWRHDGVTDEYAPDYPFQIRTVIDVDAMRADPQFEEMLVRGHRVQLSLTQWWRTALDDAGAMCEELARFSDSTCSTPGARGSLG